MVLGRPLLLWRTWSRREIATYLVLAGAVVAGLIGLSPWLIVFGALLLSLARSKLINERAWEVQHEWRELGQRRQSSASSYALVLVASLSSHVVFSTVAYLLGRGMRWLVW